MKHLKSFNEINEAKSNRELEKESLKDWKKRMFDKYPKGEILKNNKEYFFFKSENDATKAHDDKSKLDLKKSKKLAVATFVNEAIKLYSELKLFIDKIWDGDVSFEEAIEGFSDLELQKMNDVIKNNPTIFKEGVPFPGDDEIFDEMLEHDEGAQLLQKLVDNFE